MVYKTLIPFKKLQNLYFEKYYELIAIDLSKQQQLYTDQKQYRKSMLQEI